MTSPGLARIESAYLAARDARDRLDVARARGDEGGRDALAVDASRTARALLAALEAMPPDDEAALAGDDRRALDAIRAGAAAALAPDAGPPVAPAPSPGGCRDAIALAAAIEAGGETLRRRLEACYGAVADSLVVGRVAFTRPELLVRLASEPDPATRRRLFLGLEPLWRVVDGDGGPASPYRALIRDSSAAWAAGCSPIESNAVALGVTGAEIEAWAVATLVAWRSAVVEPALARGESAIEPWDWWWRAGEADRALRASLSLGRLFDLNGRVHAALGANLDDLAVRLDTTPRPGRPAVPVAFTTFGARPALRSDGSWSPGAPTVLASYVGGGLGELTELVHETGHALHIAAIRTRPAFADWPDADALTEALAELVGLDTAEPRWHRRWLADAPAIPEHVALGGRYAHVALDAALALLEIRLHTDPDRPANDAWTEITATFLGISPHPEWSWWAIRGQLVQQPGYMANYAVGAVLAADLRTAIRSARGDTIDGDAGWYPWVSERLFRFGRERSARDVLHGVLGRAPSADALLGEIARARG
jgi:hypothetical protein